MSQNSSSPVQGSSGGQNNVVYEQAPTNELGVSLAPPYPGYQDAPPSYDEAILGKEKESEEGQSNYPRQPGLPFKSDYSVPVTQFGPGPSAQPHNFAAVPGIHPPIPEEIVEAYEEFGKRPIKAICQNCSSYDFTRVEDKINSEGWLWCILCCCCGIWLLSVLVKCMDGFREFNHYCQQCGKKIASYSPSFTPGSIVLLIVLSFLAVALIGFACYFRMMEAGAMNH